MQHLSRLAARQNTDGGWGYGTGGSWVEPTVLAILALSAAGEMDSQAIRRGRKWIAENQRPDGGWPPRASVTESTWVTALVLLLPSDASFQVDLEAAKRWLLNRTGRESSWVERWRAFLATGRMPQKAPTGWPWFSDTATWVIPTCFSLLALQRAYRRSAGSAVLERCESAREFLLARQCRDGGWNHGSTKALGYDSGSYPETTGLALLALHGVDSPRLTASIQMARRYLQVTTSLEAESWLRMGLLAHGVRTPDVLRNEGHGGTEEHAIAALAEAAAQGRDFFLVPS